MNKLKIFISSVQSEFASERQMLFDYISTDTLLAEPMYLAGYIERMGTGILDMIKACLVAGLKEPSFVQKETFTTILWRKEQVTQQVKNLVLILEDEMTRDELQDKLQLKDRENFRKLYIAETLESGFIEMTKTDKPNSPDQKYRLTEKGKQLQKQLKAK